MTSLKRAATVSCFMSLALFGVMVGSADAISVSAKPSKPTVTSISAQRRSGKVDVTVTFRRAITHRKSPVLASQVRVGTGSCIAAGKATSCTVKGLVAKTTVAVTVRSRNKNGFGSWGERVQFEVAPGSTWRRGVVAPAPVSSTTMVPGTVVSSNLRFDLTGAVGLATVNAVSASGVRAASSGSSLETVDSKGQLKSAVASGSAMVRRFLIAPKDRLFVEFSDAPEIGGSPCLLAEVNRATGLPTCIERDTKFRFMGTGQDPLSCCVPEFRPLRNDIQFDDAGNIYYAGIPGTWEKDFPGLTLQPDFCGSPACKRASVVRRYSNGTVRDFGLAKLERGKEDELAYSTPQTRSVMIRRPIYNFLVLPSGKILIHEERDLIPVATGCNTAPKCHNVESGVDIWSPDGSHEAMPMNLDGIGFMISIDENTFLIGGFRATYGDETKSTHTQGPATVKISTRGGSLVVEDMFGKGGASGSALFTTDSFGCGQVELPYDFTSYFCQAPYAARSVWRTPSGKVFLVAGHDRFTNLESYSRLPSVYDEWVRAGAKFGSGVLYQTWPEVKSTRVGRPQSPTDIERIESHTKALNYFFASGLDASSKQVTLMYDTESESVSTLIPAELGIRASALAYSAKTNALLLSGVKISDGSSFFGSIDLNSKMMNVASVSKQIVDLQTFSS